MAKLLPPLCDDLEKLGFISVLWCSLWWGHHIFRAYVATSIDTRCEDTERARVVWQV